MPEPGSQVPVVTAFLAAALLAMAGFSILWQLLRAVRRKDRSTGFPAPLFWVGIFAWVTLGFLLRSGACCGGIQGVWRWLLPSIGLLVLAVVQWFGEGLSQVHAEDSGGAGADESGDQKRADLDADDMRLLHRLVVLLGRRAAGLMVPMSQVSCASESDGLNRVLELLTAHEGVRIPVLDRSRSRVLGVIDGRELVPRLFPESAAEPDASNSSVARDLCRPIPSVSAREPAREALEALRRGKAGVAAVVDPRGQVIGFLAWQPIFRTLLGCRFEGRTL
ncbi:MAG: hypothetical protein KAY24_02965 [Candidatus Eisenbacteria sp.]|nr:hypothetical protein [Candidatus Eisenbacteria bacterium]